MTAPRHVLVTGGAGFVGSHLVERLVDAGVRVSILDDLSRGRPEWVAEGCRVYRVDLRDAAGVAAAVGDARADAVAHLAALHFIPAVDEAPELAEAINVTGTQNVLAALAVHPPTRLLFASTAAVYPDSAGPVPESIPPAPTDLYGRTKLAGERLVQRFAAETGASCVVARIFNVVGPRETNPHVVPEIVNQLLAGADELELGNLEPERDFIDVRDVAGALGGLLLDPPTGVSVFNVGTGRSVSVRGLVAECERVLGRPIPVRRAEARARAVERMRLVADVSALAARGWRPRHTIGDTLADLLGSPPCVCGSTEYRTVLQGSFDRVHLRRYDFAVAECERCGLARTLPVPDVVQYRNGYSMTTCNGSFAGSAEDAWSRKRAAWIASRARPGRLLDVGCNSGNLVAAAAELGFEAEGIDIDPLATEWGAHLGRPLRTAALEDVDGPYDVVVLSHVLEHVGDPAATLREVARVLAPGGRAFVFVPNRAGLLPRLMRERWMGWVPSEHAWHFTPGTLRRTVEGSAPLRVVACTSRGAIEPASAGAKGAVKAGVAAVARGLGRGDQLEAVLERAA